MLASVSKIDAAVDQLDWSIRLFLDHRAFIPAITLAGAAEGIIGEPLEERAAATLLVKHLSKQQGLAAEQVVKRKLNHTKNWMKHGYDTTVPEILRTDLEAEAIGYIVRAMINLVSHDRTLPSEAPRFFDWLQNNRHDLHPLER